MPSSPPSPLRFSNRHSRRRSSNIDIDPMSPVIYTPNGFMHGSPGSPLSLRLSAPPSPVEPRQHYAQSMNGSARMSVDFGTPEEAGNGLGNLADELADAWEDEDGGYGYASGQEAAPLDSTPLDRMRTRTPSPGYSSGRDSLQPPRPKQRNGTNRHRRHESQYDGSDYGNDSDFEEVPDMSPGLENQIAEIESLARRGLENNGSENDHVIERAVTALQDLGVQSGIENSAMRLITAHSSITSYLTHQTRTLQNLTHPLLFAPFPLLSDEAIDALIPLIDDDLLPSLPYPFSDHQQQTHHSPRSDTPSQQNPSSNPLTSLQTLISQTSDITLSLRGLSDTLYESRQLTSTASRRLRSARELVADLRREEEGREEGTRWIERGDWDRKLREREAGRECGDVVSGFEAFCGEWREKLFGAAAAGEAVAA
ncbi:hypothetical protein BJY04DRAFT_63809 [Aspergillus karnatakaensis]|uniref:uncharacterized protein n=1 Tax=Aspergillus karnatakaensis TaxID=1810916 RepID=UPI003CCCE0F6